MEEELNLLDKQVILRILGESEKSEDKDRRIQSFDAYQVYSGNQKIYIERALARTRPNSFESYTISNISVSKMITDKRAQAYNEGAIRSVDGGESKTEKLKQIYNEAEAEEELCFHDVVMNLNRYNLIWVNYREKDQKYQLMTLHPYEFILVRDQDTGEVLIVGLNYPDTEITQNARGDNSGVERTVSGGDGISDLIAESQADSGGETNQWAFWSKDQHVVVRQTKVRVVINGNDALRPSIEYVDVPGNPNNVNPLGVVPFVYTSFDRSIDYPTVNPLTEQSITFNVQQSETLTSKNIHGSGIQVIKYPEKMEGRFNKMSSGQTEVVKLPQSSKDGDSATEFDYKTSGAQLGPMMDSDMKYLKQIMKDHDIEGTNMELGESNAISGISKAISGASVQKLIERHQRIYAKTEQKIFEVIKAWDRLNRTKFFSPEDELQVVFPRPKVMLSDRETLENIKMMMEMGLIEEWEKFIKMDPNLSEQQAREKLERVNSEREKKAQKLLSRGMNDNIEERVSKEGAFGSEGSKPTE